MIDWRYIRYFSRGEFGRHDDIEPDEDLVFMLEQARGIAGIPFKINSGIRSPERNAAVGGADDSSHLTGHGVDIHCPSSRQRFLMITALIEAGAHRIGVYDEHIHVDTNPAEARDVMWLG